MGRWAKGTGLQDPLCSPPLFTIMAKAVWQPRLPCDWSSNFIVIKIFWRAAALKHLKRSLWNSILSCSKSSVLQQASEIHSSVSVRTELTRGSAALLKSLVFRRCWGTGGRWSIEAAAKHLQPSFAICGCSPLPLSQTSCHSIAESVEYGEKWVWVHKASYLAQYKSAYPPKTQLRYAEKKEGEA